LIPLKNAGLSGRRKTNNYKPHPIRPFYSKARFYVPSYYLD